MDVVPHSPNLMLSALSPADFALLSPYLRTVEMVHETVLVKTEETIAVAYFPHGGVISLVMPLSGGEMIEVGMIGRDSLFGGAAAIDGRMSMNDAIVQLPGAASVIDIEHLRRAANQSSFLRALLVRNEEFVLAQAQQTAACNASHALPARLARWLLRVRDLNVNEQMNLTQEFLGQMLGVQRSSVSLVANTLQNAGVIRYRRGNVEIINSEGLEEIACECYATLRARGRYLLSAQGA